MPGLTVTEAAHLLRRMSFGGSSAEIDALTGKDRETAVNSLIDYESVGNQEMDDILTRGFPFLRFSSSTEVNAENFNATEIRGWWITRFLFSKRPFEEKMTLFWHNHFATSIDTVPPIHMYTQNLALRQNALGKFEDLLLKISQGAAMLIWLNGAESSRENPNENFARELQELFTMSPADVVTSEPNYTETDVKEIARAFAGWRFRQKDSSVFGQDWYIDAAAADSGGKTIYSQTANFSGEDVITILADNRATARYLVYKLFNFFVYPMDLTLAADKQTIDKFADVYMRRNHSIKELVRAIFQSDEFFSPRALWGLVKSPVEYVVGTIRALRLSYSPGTLELREIAIQSSLANMGMSMFAPPNVAGWKVYLGFINTETLLGRYNFSNTMMFDFGSKLAPTLEDIRRYTKPTTKKSLKKLLNTLNLELDSAVIRELEQYMLLDRQGNQVAWPPPGGQDIFKMRGVIRLIMCLPEYQLN